MFDLKLVARLRALERGRAQRCATHLRVAVQAHALVVAPIAMAGEDRIHAVAVGGVGEPPELLCVPDPRRRDAEYALLRELAVRLETCFRECLAAETYPQIWVSSEAGAALLDGLAERSRYVRPGRGDEERAEGVRRFGTLLSYFTDRYPHPGQQALLTATGALSEHFATGQEEGEDEHLGAFLCWMEPPMGADVIAAVAASERVPMGVKTDPEFDKDVLEPLVRAYNEARREDAPDRTLVVRAAAIERELAPQCRRVYAAIQRAVELLQDPGMPPLTALEALEQRETEEFEDFMRSRDAGYHLTLRDRPKAAAFKLSAREDAAQNYEAAVMVGDGVGRAQGRMSGRIVRGAAENPRTNRVSSGKCRYFFDLVSDQRVLRVRRGDELRLLDGRTFKVVVGSVSREEEATRLSVELVEGMRAVGLPEAGAVLELASRLPDWRRLWRERAHLSSRLARTPWTHSDARPPSAPLRTSPDDPLSAVEGLR